MPTSHNLVVRTPGIFGRLASPFLGAFYQKAQACSPVDQEFKSPRRRFFLLPSLPLGAFLFVLHRKAHNKKHRCRRKAQVLVPHRSVFPASLIKASAVASEISVICAALRDIAYPEPSVPRSVMAGAAGPLAIFCFQLDIIDLRIRDRNHREKQHYPSHTTASIPRNLYKHINDSSSKVNP